MQLDLNETLTPNPAQTADGMVTPTSTALVERPNYAAPSTYVEDGESQGEFDASDTQKAYLTIVAKTGQLSNIFNPGDLLINKEFVVGGTKSPIEVVAGGMRKRYQNDLDFEGGEMGDVVDTAAEVQSRGGVVDYRPFGDKLSTNYWKPIMQFVLLIKAPASLPAAATAFFPYQIDGANYGLVGYTARTKTAYNGIAKPLNTVRQAKGTVRGHTFQLSTKGDTYQGRSWIQPSIRITGDTSDAVRAFLKETVR